MPINAPKITGGDTRSITIDEGVTAVTTVAATDTDGDTINFKIVGGADKSKFKIDPVTGVLTFIGAPDFEDPSDSSKDASGTANGKNTYEVIVQAADGSLTSGTTLKDTQTITVTIDNVVPAEIDGTSGDDTLNAADGTTVEADTLNGLAGDDILDGGVGADIMIGGADDDTYFVDNTGDIVDETDGSGNDEGGTDSVSSSVTYTLSVFVENLTLTGTGTINGTGNALNNTITGNDKANKINGAGGDDTLIGGKGNDIYYVDTALDAVTEAASEGTDLVIASVSTTLSNNVENLTLLSNVDPLDDDDIDATGNILNNVLKGNAGVNILTGNAGTDKLDGGAGNDDMIGGTGNDSYYVDSSGDDVTEDAGTGTGTDIVYATADYELTDNVENLTLKGTADIDGTGNDLNNKIIGNNAVNVLIGGLGNDLLDGKKGADDMSGGDGNDTYYVERAGDSVTELDEEGTDLVIAYVNHTLSDFVENLTLAGTALEGTGNAENNTIKGNSSANVLDGGDGNDTLDGGSGNDDMTGGDGDDIFVVNATGDAVHEGSGLGSGMDEVKSSVTIATLADNVEMLTLTGFSAVNGTGNDENNVITGNGAANVLNGGDGNDELIGGSGNDTMDGNDGSDIYYVAQAGDIVSDSGTGLTDVDKVFSTATVTLDASIENVELTGTGAINATGNNSDNVMTGNTGINLLAGGDGDDTIDGGSGNDKITGGDDVDTMTGGIGSDTFIFADVTDSGTSAGVDTDMVTDFTSSDKIDVQAIDARDDADFQHFILSTDDTGGEGEIVMTRSGNVVTIELHTDADLTADMVFQVTVDSSITGELLLGNFIL